jgi:protease YdgD
MTSRLTRGRLARCLFIGLFCVSCFAGHTATGEPQPGIFGKDDRRLIDQPNKPHWGAIGQVNVAGYRHAKKCTGSLIARNLVITAAHCVMSPWSGKPFPLHQIHFVAGVRGSTWLAHSTAKCLHFHPAYKYIGLNQLLPSRALQKVPLHSLARDVVLIELTEEFRTLAPLEMDYVEGNPVDLALVHASYSADRRYRLTAHFGCRLLAQDQDLWFTDCDTNAASSGGPVFIQSEHGTLKLAAIMVGLIRESASVAVPNRNWSDVATKPGCP